MSAPAILLYDFCTVDIMARYQLLNNNNNNETCFFVLQRMNEIDTWGTNIFDIGESANNRPLTAVTYTILVVSLKNYATGRDKSRQASGFSNPDRQSDQLQALESTDKRSAFDRGRPLLKRAGR